VPISEARPEAMVFAPLTQGNSGSSSILATWGEVGIETPAGFDFHKARAMLQKRLDEVRLHLDRNQRRYDDSAFRAKADATTIDEIAERIEQLKAQQSLLESQIELIH
jgi:valyl-tRNA synthetase